MEAEHSELDVAGLAVVGNGESCSIDKPLAGLASEYSIASISMPT